MQDFASVFEALTGTPPFPWQTSLHACFIAGSFPESVNIPTGLGKTSVVAIWLIALAEQPDKVPRRLVYVVNRRTVVDQTTTEIENIRRNLTEKPELAEIAANLATLAALPCASPLAVSTLRGQQADNAEWRTDPSRSAVVIGTVDMIGSGLLFSRYNASFRMRPFHAGLLGQDTLVVHDEAHLEPAFQTLLETIRDEQQGKNSASGCLRDLRPLRVMAMTATSRSDVVSFSVTDDDRANATVRKRLEAVKKLSLIEIGDGEDLKDKIAESARELTGAVLVFVRSVETALKIADALDKGDSKGCVATLTGTLRGKERDDLADRNPIFQRFLPKKDCAETSVSARETVFLVCTSAGEVGVNISADHCVCDLSTYESMAQRFGRVNRFGERDDSTITVFHETAFGKKKAKSDETVKTPLDLAREKTLAALTALDGNASPKALAEHPAPEAFSPPPEIRVATQIQFDAWALTSIRAPIAARPPVTPYLHGEAEWQPPETHLAWRDDLDFKHVTDLEDFLDRFPLRPQELLRDTTARIVATLDRLIKDKTDLPDAWLITENGSVSLLPLRGFDKDKTLSVLEEATLILPTSLGGLENGLFTGKGSASDVSSIERRHSPTRDSSADFSLDVSDENDDEPRFLHWFALRPSVGKPHPFLVPGAVGLADHTVAVTANTRTIVAKLGLPADLQAALITSAEHHDDGKARVQWQRAIGNRDYPNTVLAKSNGAARATAETYRHEFGSLATYSGLDAHCIAAHHGRARPHFPTEEIYDPSIDPVASAERAAQIPLRFAKLQRQYGRWGLAYLESILRAADYAASAGIVAETATPPHVTPAPAEPRTCTPPQTGTVSLALDPANPGHFFACCGLFELASCLYPESVAHFDGNRFIISGLGETTLSILLANIIAAEISAVDEDDKPLTPIRIANFDLYLDWWRYEGGGIGKLKTWAGQMSICGIANDMRQAMGKELNSPDCICDDILYRYSQENTGQPYYFDANYAVNAQAQDVGFSIDKLGKGGVNIIPATRPAVELLCLVGLQRARPLLAVNEKGKERLYDYHTWETPNLGALVPAAVAGLLSDKGRHYRFANPSRAKDYRAFMPASLLNP